MSDSVTAEFVAGPLDGEILTVDRAFLQAGGQLLFFNRQGTGEVHRKPGAAHVVFETAQRCLEDCGFQIRKVDVPDISNGLDHVHILRH